jgi:hypothetical protein
VETTRCDLALLCAPCWGPDSIERIRDERGEMNGGQEIPGELVVLSGDTPEVPEPAKQRSIHRQK